MVKKKFILFRDQIRDFCRKGWESKVIGVKGDIIVVEAEVPEEMSMNNNIETMGGVNERVQEW
jgi:hypothetical protein